MRWIKFFWDVLGEELTLKSKHGMELGNDTFQRWIFTFVVCCIFYLFIHHFDEHAIWMDNWLQEYFNWKKSTPPSPGKVAWHRTLAAGLCGIAVLSATVEYLMCFCWRIRARLAATRK